MSTGSWFKVVFTIPVGDTKCRALEIVMFGIGLCFLNLLLPQGKVRPFILFREGKKPPNTAH